MQIQTQNSQSVLPLYYRTGDSAGDKLKSGVNLGLDHLYFLALIDLIALSFGFLFGFVVNPTPGFGAPS